MATSSRELLSSAVRHHVRAATRAAAGRSRCGTPVGLSSSWQRWRPSPSTSTLPSRRLGYPFELEWLEGWRGRDRQPGGPRSGDLRRSLAPLRAVPVSAPLHLGLGRLRQGSRRGLPGPPSGLLPGVAGRAGAPLAHRPTRDGRRGGRSGGRGAVCRHVPGERRILRPGAGGLALPGAAACCDRRGPSHGQTWRAGAAVGLLLFLSFFTKQTALIAAVPTAAVPGRLPAAGGSCRVPDAGGAPRGLHRGARSRRLTAGTTTTSSRSSRAKGSTPTPSSRSFRRACFAPRAGLW